jgi:predicted dehydrogenase
MFSIGDYFPQEISAVNCLVVGYGSIGMRHANILKEMGHSVHVVSKRNVKEFSCNKTIRKALEEKHIDYVVISNETYKHYESFMEFRELGYSGKILIEKPAFSELHSLRETIVEDVFVAYNLRFHPVVQKLRALLQENQIYSIQAYSGQYLPDWRPGTDYTNCYSASKDMGGGVLRDLSHELDYINWIAGAWQRVTAIGGKFSDLQIDSDDNYVVLLEMKNCPIVSVQMNYLDRKARREIIINLKGNSIKADLILNTLEIRGEVEKFETERNLTYILQHKAILNGHYDYLCTLDQGMDVLKLIHAAEVAADKQIWINSSDFGECF